MREWKADMPRYPTPASVGLRVNQFDSSHLLACVGLPLLLICSCWRSDRVALFSLYFCDHVRAILVETFQPAAQKRAKGRMRLHSLIQAL